MTTSTRPPAAFERSAATSQDQSDRSLDECFICEQTLWLSFFFDALLHDQEEDDRFGQLTNLAKMFYAFKPSRKDLGRYRFYYEGLGKSLHPTAVSETAAAARDAIKRLEKGAEKKVKDEAKKIVTEKAKEKVGMESKPWAFKPRDILKIILQKIAGATIEHIASLRDDPQIASTFNTGVQARIDKALLNFDNAIAEQELEVTTVNIAVFGADRGGSIARAFVNELIARKATPNEAGGWSVETPRGKARLRIRFVGLFDCVAHVVPDSSMRKAIDFLGKRIGAVFLSMLGPSIRSDFKLTLPQGVEKVVHLAAGMELRPTRVLDTVRDSACAYIERLYPGSQLDVVGGLAPMERGRSNQLSRVPLQGMLDEAFSAGVPVYSLDQLKVVNARLHDDQLLLTDQVSLPEGLGQRSVRELSLAYRRAAGRHADIKEELLGFQKQLISALRIQHETAPTASSTEAATSATFLRRQPAYLDTSMKTLLAAWDAPDITPEAMALYAHLFNDAHRDWLDQWMPTDNGIHPLFRVRLVSGLESQVDKVTKQATEPVKKKVAEYNAPEAVQRRQWDREAAEYRRAVPPLPR
jgi:hypothetical protein